jgi:HSP20 family protein
MSEKKKETTAVAVQDASKETAVARAVPAPWMTPFDEMDRLFEALSPRGWLRPWRREWPAWIESHLPLEGRLPRVDVIDRERDVALRAELPGLRKEDIEVSLTDNTLTLRGKTTHEEKQEEKGEYFRREILHGEFARTVALPCDVDGERALATFRDGVLEVVIPKAERAQRRTVTVR